MCCVKGARSRGLTRDMRVPPQIRALAEKRKPKQFAGPNVRIHPDIEDGPGQCLRLFSL